MGSDVAIQSADIALMNNDLNNIPFVMSLARSTKSIMYQNIGIAFSVSLIMMILAAVGVIPRPGRGLPPQYRSLCDPDQQLPHPPGQRRGGLNACRKKFLSLGVRFRAHIPWTAAYTDVYAGGRTTGAAIRYRGRKFSIWKKIR